ncbi:MAG: tRNA-dihydrouridine synthase, partial [Bacteroidota bacterium]|nr:tRNA-dihydrouridine synthase [Bacteroidota bacterium]
MQDAQHIINKIRGKALLAPMLATTDIPFRTLCARLGAALTYTEMVSATGIARSSSHSFRNAVFTAEERPVALQLVAANPWDAQTAARKLLPLNPDMFDINCGCPNERICEAGAGAQLLDDLPRFAAVIEATVNATAIPVAVKVRMQGLHSTANVREIVRAATDSGALFIAIHARARNAAYHEAARWEVLAEAVASSGIPVIGNGDIFSADDAFRMFEQTGVHAVMVARGSLGTPWIFRQINQGRRCGLHEGAPEAEELAALIRGHLEHLLREFGAVRALPRIRKHALWYARSYAQFDPLRRTLFDTEDPVAVIETAARFF